MIVRTAAIFLHWHEKDGYLPILWIVLTNWVIPPEKATYVCQIDSNEDGKHDQFSYRIAGNILCEETSKGIGRCCHEPYPYGAPGFPEPHFDLEFWLTLPWVLDEQGSDPKREGA